MKCLYLITSPISRRRCLHACLAILLAFFISTSVQAQESQAEPSGDTVAVSVQTPPITTPEPSTPIDPDSTDGSVTQTTTADASDDASKLPQPFAWALVVIVLCGALGAFAADLAADGGNIERGGRTEKGWALGFITNIVIGSVAALILLTLNPPDGGWLSLIGTALSAGVGGEAIIVAIMASFKAQAEGKEREKAEDTANKITETAKIKLEGMKKLAMTLQNTSRLNPAEALTEESAMLTSVPRSSITSAGSPLSEALTVHVEDAIRELETLRNSVHPQ